MTRCSPNETFRLRLADSRVRVFVVSSDLISASRIAEAAARSGLSCLRIDEPTSLPTDPAPAVAFVDWDGRQPGWGEALRGWADAGVGQRRLVLYGPHTDLDAHHDARTHHIGPVLARSNALMSPEKWFAVPSRPLTS